MYQQWARPVTLPVSVTDRRRRSGGRLGALWQSVKVLDQRAGNKYLRDCCGLVERISWVAPGVGPPQQAESCKDLVRARDGGFRPSGIAPLTWLMGTDEHQSRLRRPSRQCSQHTRSALAGTFAFQSQASNGSGLAVKKHSCEMRVLGSDVSCGHRCPAPPLSI